MGIYSEYLNRKLTFDQLAAERKKQLQRISQIRGRDVLVYAADISKNAPITIDYSDLLPVQDQLANLHGKGVDVIIETPGGSGEIAEQIVRMLRSKYESVSFIIPGTAKSAGTILVMSGDEILMGPTSALGPIDAQIQWQGKQFSADALLEGMEKIKEEVTKNGQLNRAYIPILQGISPGELQSAENALNFAKILVTQWLAQNKFRTWQTHSSTGQPVTEDEKKARAKEIADKLCNHRDWLTHGRSILMEDLRAMRVLVTDYTEHPKLGDAIARYYTLLRMTFGTNIYKVIETPGADSQVYRLAQQSAPAALPAGPPVPAAAGAQAIADVEVGCNNCGHHMLVQANLGKAQPLQAGRVPYPASNRVNCPKCGTEHDLSDIRRQIEVQAGQPIVT